MKNGKFVKKKEKKQTKKFHFHILEINKSEKMKK